MPMKYCLPKDDADRLRAALNEATDLSEMTSEERHLYFANIIGEQNAGPVNALFESKLLLKNKKAGMIAWAKSVMGPTNPKVKQDVISKIEGLNDVLNARDEDAFLSDLAEHKMGIRLSFEEAKKISDLSEQVTLTKMARDAGGDRMPYGRAVVALRDFLDELKLAAGKITMADFKANPGATVGKIAHAAAGNTKAIVASMDNSAIFRQGWKTLWTHPGIWQHNARISFVNLVKAFGSDAVMKELNADIVSRPNYDLMKRAGLKVYDVNEEAFPTSFPEKIPIIGKFYKSSEHAYTAFVQKTRADVFDKYIEIATDSWADMPNLSAIRKLRNSITGRGSVDLKNDEDLQGIGKLVNSLTGRGNLGAQGEKVAGAINNVFFSPRMVKSHVDTLTAHAFENMGSQYWSFARKQAAINLVKIIGGIAAILTIARALKKDSVEFDPRSADFGKIKIGHTRFDMTGGMGSLAVLAARLATQASKSSTTGKVHPLNSGKFGSQTGMDVAYNFFENKLSPVASLVRDMMKGRTFSGEKPGILNEAQNLFVPMTITNAMEIYRDPDSANIVLAVLADALGISTNTYGPYKKQVAHK